MIRNIVFDWGGVLSPTDTPIAANALADKYRLDTDELLLEMSRLEPIYSREADDKGFFDELNKKYQVPSEDVELAICSVKPNEVLGYAKELSKVYPVFLLSDQMRFKGEYIKSHFDISFFTRMVFSYEIGHIKKDANAFKEFLERTGIAAKESVFIDDRNKNIENAKQCGFATIRFTDLSSLKLQLGRLIQDSTS